MLPDELFDLTIPQMRVIFSDPQALDEAWRWKRMAPHVRERAREYKEKFGRF